MVKIKPAVDFKTQYILDHLRSMLIFNAQELGMNSWAGTLN